MHGYLVMFIAMFVEGPIVTAAAAFAAALGFFNLWIVFVLAVAGDLFADLVYYAIGYFTRLGLIQKYEARLRMTSTQMEKIRSQLQTHAGKTIVAIKLAPFLAGPGLIVVGASHFSPRRFTILSLAITVPKVLLFMGLGYYFGYAYDSVSQYANYGIYALVGALVLAFTIRYLYQKLSARIAKKMAEF